MSIYSTVKERQKDGTLREMFKLFAQDFGSTPKRSMLEPDVDSFQRRPLPVVRLSAKMVVD